MKTLNEQISEIKNSQVSNNKKQQALIKLGLRDHEINILFASWSAEERIARSEMFRFTFGVEIECNIYRSTVEQVFASNGVNYHYEGYNHTDNREYYKFVTDASVSGLSPIECVSPVLTGNTNGFKSLEACCKSLNQGNAYVNKSCGLHVHIGGNITDKQYCNTFVNYKMLEDVIDTFMAFSRRADENGYCRSVKHLSFSECNNPSDVQYACHHSRYFKINAMSWTRHRTIEFRQHQGTTNYEKISNWVNFCAKLVGWSKNNRLANRIESIDDIPFLTDTEKAYFKARKAEFDAR